MLKTLPFENQIFLMNSEQDARFAIITEISLMVRKFFPETLVGFSDIYRRKNGAWTVSLYMPETEIRETYVIGMLFSDQMHTL